MRRIQLAISAGMDALLEHKRRSILSSLGVFFGVASVVAMLSVGEGARRVALAQVRALGTRTVWIRPPENIPQNLPETADTDLTMRQLTRAAGVLPEPVAIAGFKKLNARVWGAGFESSAPVIAANANAARVTGMNIVAGRFINDADTMTGAQVCVIGKHAAGAMKPTPTIGDSVRVNDQWFKVIGIVTAAHGAPPKPSIQSGDKNARSGLFSFPVSSMSPRHIDDEIYVPLHPAIVYPARSSATLSGSDEWKTFLARRAGVIKETRIPPPSEDIPLDECVVRFSSDSVVPAGAGLLNSALTRIKGTASAHVISVPLNILAQVARTRRLFNLVLGSIAAISLLVGGIGIMNILTASVAERTREIGIRRASGARRSDIAFQFIAEAMLLSLIGTAFGILAGLAGAFLIQTSGGIPTAFSGSAVVYATLLALSCSGVFGVAPALHAARISPATALRAT